MAVKGCVMLLRSHDIAHRISTSGPIANGETLVCKSAPDYQWDRQSVREFCDDSRLKLSSTFITSTSTEA